MSMMTIIPIIHSTRTLYVHVSVLNEIISLLNHLNIPYEVEIVQEDKIPANSVIISKKGDRYVVEYHGKTYLLSSQEIEKLFIAIKSEYIRVKIGRIPAKIEIRGRPRKTELKLIKVFAWIDKLSRVTNDIRIEDSSILIKRRLLEAIFLTEDIRQNPIEKIKELINLGIIKEVDREWLMLTK